MAFGISNLRERPDFRVVVADRVWRAWWKEMDVPLAYICGRVDENLTAATIPFALVAHEGDRFLGTASAIAADLDGYPQFTPWVAAVWVEPEQRNRGIGAALVRAVADGIFDLGHMRAYLCASTRMRPFYQKRGWICVEEDAGPRRLTILSLTPAPA